MEHFANHTTPSAERRRELLVMWVDKAYRTLEAERIAKEQAGEHSLHMLAFLRTGCLVSSNGDDVDAEINPEGTAKVFTDSKDSYYKDHNITSFRELLVCSDGECGHVQPRAQPASLSRAQRRNDEAVAQSRFEQLEQSSDERAILIVRCVKRGLKWAGSSFVVFMGGGVDRLLEFLSEQDDKGDPAHDVDMYRTSKDTPSLGKRMVDPNGRFPVG
jgi:hypothetical protein